MPSPYEQSELTKRKLAARTLKFNRSRLRLVDLGEHQPTWDELVQTVKGFDRETAFHTLARIENLFTNLRFDSHEVQSYCSSRFIANDIIKKVNALIGKIGIIPLLFDPQSILNLQKLFISFGQPGGSRMETTAEIAKFGNLMLAANGLMDAGTGVHSTVQEIQSLTIRNTTFNRQQQLAYLAPRYWDLYVSLPKEFRSRTTFDIAGTYLKATGVTIEETLSIGYAFLQQWNQVTLANAHQFPVDINPAHFLSQTRLTPEKINLAFAQFAQDWEKHRQDIGEVRAKEAWEYRFMGAQRRPLVSLSNDTLLPFGTHFFQEKVTAHVYWTINEHLKGDAKSWHSFTAAYGELFEEYILRILQGIYGNEIRKIYHGPSHVEQGDALLLAGHEAFIFECKTPRLLYETRTTGNLALFEKDLERNLLHAAKQADGVISQIRKGELDTQLGRDHTTITSFQPVLVLEDSLPQDALLWKLYSDLFDSRLLFKQPGVKRPLLVTAEEVEMLEPLLLKGASLGSIISDKMQKPEYADTPIHNMIVDMLKGPRELPNKRMVDKYQALTEVIHKTLF